MAQGPAVTQGKARSPAALNSNLHHVQAHALSPPKPPSQLTSQQGPSYVFGQTQPLSSGSGQQNIHPQSDFSHFLPEAGGPKTNVKPSNAASAPFIFQPTGTKSKNREANKTEVDFLKIELGHAKAKISEQSEDIRVLNQRIVILQEKIRLSADNSPSPSHYSDLSNTNSAQTQQTQFNEDCRNMVHQLAEILSELRDIKCLLSTYPATDLTEVPNNPALKSHQPLSTIPSDTLMEESRKLGPITINVPIQPSPNQTSTETLDETDRQSDLSAASVEEFYTDTINLNC